VQNNERTGVWIGALIALAGLALIFLPALLGADMMSLGYGLGFIGVFILITGLITALVFWARARTMDRLLAGEEVLAHWTYQEFEGQQQVETEYKRVTDRNRGIYLVMVFWFVLIGGVFVGADYYRNGQVNGLFMGLFFGCLLLLGAVAFLAPILWRRQASKASRQVIISRSGLVMNGVLHSWKGPFERLVGVEYQQDLDGPALVFSIRYLSRIEPATGSTETVIVPVPPGEQEAARRVMNSLKTMV
jgi:amino acid transporter